MANPLKAALLAFAVVAMIVGEAHAIALNRCIKIVRNPQVSRETLVNTCQQCLIAKIERRRPGSATGTPQTRDYTLPGGASQPLPFMGPGKSRILSEVPCPQAR